MATIANGGKLVTPRIVKSITDSRRKNDQHFFAGRFATGNFARDGHA